MVAQAQSILAIVKRCPSPIHDLYDAEIERDLLDGTLKTRLIGNTENIALCLYSIDGKELFIAALKSVKTNHEIPLAETTLAELETIAKEHGCEYLRFHTFRPGLVAKALENGFIAPEFILRKRIT